MAKRKKRSSKKRATTVSAIKAKIKAAGYTLPHGYEIRKCKRCHVKRRGMLHVHI